MPDSARVTTRSPAQALALGLLVLAAVAFLALSGNARAVGYQVITNPDSSRTVTWNLSNPAAFVLDNVSLVNGKAVLSRQPMHLAWSSGADLARNGTIGSNITSDTNGIELAANLTNYVPDGDFRTGGPWSYQNGSTGNVVANWEPRGDVLLGHNSSSTQVMFDSLDSTPSVNWTQVSSGSCSIILSNVSGGQKQGLGMYRANISVPGSCAYAGMQRTSTVNWSAYDTLLLWVNATFHGGMTFNLSAISGATTHWTTTQSLNFGWNEVLVDLTKLGPQRGSLSQVTLRFIPSVTGQFVLYLDDIRVGHAVRFNESATVTESFVKANSTASKPGTALFSFDWQVVNRTGANFASADVTLVAPSGGRTYTLLNASIGRWFRSSADVSGLVASPGTYAAWVNVTLATNTSYEVDTRVRIDNVSLTFPGRHNGTYTSKVVDLLTANYLSNCSLGLTLAPGTSGSVTFRGSLSTNPLATGWDFRFTWNQSGVYSLTGWTARTIQLLAVLNTTNASQTPILTSFVLYGEHYAALGELTTQPLTADPAFLFWRNLSATAEYLAAPTASNVSYWLGEGSSWSSIRPGDSLIQFTLQTIQIRVILQTNLGLFSPSLDSLSLTYDFLGPLAAVALSPTNATVVTGGSLQFRAAALDSGNHANQSVFFDWRTDDPSGSISATGLYRAGQPGMWAVTAVALVPGLKFQSTTQVTVLATPIGALLFNPLVIGIPGVVLVLGAGYALVSRRLFAIDDVFLVSRDGRLMSHNTRRLLADRDEDMLSGMLTAISAFVRDSWRDENGHLRRFDFGGKRTLIERGEHVFLAAVYSGRVPRWASRDLRAFGKDLETRFGPAFAKWDGSPEDLQKLRDVMARYVSKLRYNRRRVWNGFSL